MLPKPLWKKAANHPLALKREAEWKKKEFWEIFRTSAKTRAPCCGSLDSSMLSCCPESSWTDGKAAVFLLFCQFKDP